MYNEEMKQCFIGDYTDSLKTARAAQRIFDMFAPYENAAGKDICTFSTEELQPIVDEVLAMRGSSKAMPITILRAYGRWCIAQSYGGACDSAYHVKLLGLKKVEQYMVASPLHLQKRLDTVFASEDKETVDNIYRVFFWLAFAGLSDTDALLVKKTDVDMSTLSINYQGQSYPLYRESIPAIRNAVQLTEFSYEHPKYTKAGIIKRTRPKSDLLVIGMKEENVLTTLRSTISNQVGKVYPDTKNSPRLSFSRIWLSGCFYRMYEQERADMPVDFTDIAAQEVVGRSYKQRADASYESTVKWAIRAKAREFEENYMRWKLVFAI